MKVLLIGAGQVGRALASAFRQRGIPHRLFAYRAELPAKLPSADLLLLCTRDGQLPQIVERLQSTQLPPRLVIAHLAGALGLEVLEPLRPNCLGIAQLHPYCSILSIGHPRAFQGVPFVVSGNRAAVVRLRQLLEQLEAKAIVVHHIDRSMYHLSAALLANGAVALLHQSNQLLTLAGIPTRARRQLLDTLLESVRYNVSKLGPKRALTGPTRRGDVSTLARHFALLERLGGGAKSLYRGVVAAQLDIVAELHELTPTEHRKLRALVRKTA